MELMFIAEEANGAVDERADDFGRLCSCQLCSLCSPARAPLLPVHTAQERFELAREVVARIKGFKGLARTLQRGVLFESVVPLPDIACGRKLLKRVLACHEDSVRPDEVVQQLLAHLLAIILWPLPPTSVRAPVGRRK